MSDTPRTDESRGYYGYDDACPAYDMQKLERELAASQAGRAELLARLQKRTDSYLAASARDVQTIQRQAVELSKWQALAEGLADAGSELREWPMTTPLRPLDIWDAALAAYEAAKAGGAGAGLAVDSVALARALLETRDIQVYGDGCSTQERDTWILAKMIDTALAAKTGKPCKTCGGSKMTDGWYPTYNDPDNSGMHPEAEPCPDCQSVKLPDPLAEAVKRCDWKEDEDGNWYTSCHQFMCFEHSPPNEQGYKFCHRCGRPINFIEFAPPLDEPPGPA